MSSDSMSEHSVDAFEVLTLEKPYSVDDLMNNTENIFQSDGRFLKLTKVMNITKGKADPNNYFILFKTLSVGKYGAVYLGQDKGSKKMRTFKIFRPRMIFCHNKSSRLEKRLLCLKMKPPMFPELFMSFSFEFQNCLVLECLSGKTLQDKLRFARRLPELAIRFYMTEIVFAISFIHSKQIIHRNLTLESFWIQDNGHLKLMDYSRCVSSHAIFPRLMKTSHPNHFTAPEIISGGFITKMVDMWSMGVIMYRMTTGKMPFLTTTRKDFKHAIRFASVNFSHHFTTDAQHFCAGLMAKMPIHRIGYRTSTFSAMTSHEYFAHTNWDKVLMGTAEIPHIPILFNNEMTVLECDLNLLSGIRYKLRKKPFRYTEITSRKGNELFSDANLLELHKRKIAKDIRRQKHRRLPPDFSYLKVTSDEFIYSKESTSIDQVTFTNMSKAISQAMENSQENLCHPKKCKGYTYVHQQEKKVTVAPLKTNSTLID